MGASGISSKVEVTGRIACTPAGSEGYEWDEVSIPDGYLCIFAEV
jgi:inosine/xanthosine triphosphate pyrophosphatase family protein